MILDSLLNLFYPSICPVCGNRSDSYVHNPICSACWRGIVRYSGPACNKCGVPAVSPYTTVCESCLTTSPLFSKIIYFGIYEGALKQAIHLLKFNGVKRLSKPLSLLLSQLPISEADGIIPVPLHPKRLRQREFNQTVMLGWYLSKMLKIPLMPDVLSKIKDTLPQTVVSGKERFKNVKNAYKACAKINGLNLLLVDDVITTGATARECSGVLIDAGAINVTVVALAHSMPKHNT